MFPGTQCEDVFQRILGHQEPVRCVQCAVKEKQISDSSLKLSIALEIYIYIYIYIPSISGMHMQV